MSMCLRVEADDPEVESLLIYLDSRLNLRGLGDRASLLERTIKWMEPALHLFGVNCESVNLGKSLLSVLHPERQAEQRLDQEQVSQEDCKLSL